MVAKYSVIGFPRALVGDVEWIEDGGNKSYGTLLRLRSSMGCFSMWTRYLLPQIVKTALLMAPSTVRMLERSVKTVCVVVITSPEEAHPAVSKDSMTNDVFPVEPAPATPNGGDSDVIQCQFDSIHPRGPASSLSQDWIAPRAPLH